MRITSIDACWADRAVIRMPRMRITAGLAQVGSIAVFCMPEEPREGREGDRTHLQVPAVKKSHPPTLSDSRVHANPARHGCRAERPHGRRAKRGPQEEPWACAAVTIKSTHVASGTAVESSTRW
jgi:hypothetical protein